MGAVAARRSEAAEPPACGDRCSGTDLGCKIGVINEVATTGALARQRFLALAALIGLALWAALAPEGSHWLRLGAVAVLIALARLSIARPGAGAVVAILAAAIALAATLGLPWQLAMPAALGLLAVARWWQPRLPPDEVRAGRVPAWGTLVCAAVTPVALLGWVAITAPDLSDLTSAIPRVPAWLLLLGAVAFVLLNAYFEERIWRAVFQPRLSELFSTPAAIALQAASFGAAHAHGFPRGWIGVALAATWGGMLGVLRARAGGLLAPFLAHVVADATIAAIVLLWLGR